MPASNHNQNTYSGDDDNESSRKRRASPGNSAPAPRPQHQAVNPDGLLHTAPIDIPHRSSTKVSFKDLRMPTQSHNYRDYDPPEVHTAVRHPTRLTILPAPGEEDEEVPSVHLTNKENPAYAYSLLDKEPLSLDHHAPGWGRILFAIAFPRIPGEGLRFQAPSPDEACFVVIKELKKSVVDSYLEQGGNEDPYKEISRMQELGDNIHVLACIEALQDNEYLYIVTPRATATLRDVIPWRRPADQLLEPDLAHGIFCQLLRILSYLERHSICHRDFSPDNFIFLHENEGKKENVSMVVFDLALSVRIPVEEGTEEEPQVNEKTPCPPSPPAVQQRRSLMEPIGNFGTYAYMSPEVYSNKTYDGVGADLYSAAIILYNLLTNQVLFLRPHPTDIAFRYFIMAKALSSTPMNELAVRTMMQASDTELFARARANMNLAPEAVELLEKSLELNPSNRLSLAETIESAYVQQADF